MTPITKEDLIKAGWEPQAFFFQTGGGEDEDDREIFVKDGITITYESSYKCWCVKKHDEINYIDGFGVDNAEKIRTMEELNKMELP